MAAQQRDDDPAPALGERMAALERLVTRQREGLERRLADQARRLADQEERLGAQQEEIERLRAERPEGAPRAAPPLARGRGADDDGVPDTGGARRGSRRNLLKLGGAAAAAGVAAAAAGVMESHAAHAAPAPTGSTFILGEPNTADTTTFLQYTVPVPGSVFVVSDAPEGSSFPTSIISGVNIGGGYARPVWAPEWSPSPPPPAPTPTCGSAGAWGRGASCRIFSPRCGPPPPGTTPWASRFVTPTATCGSA